MKRNRVRRFLQQKQYTIASFVLFAAIAAMTGVYMSNKVTGGNDDMEMAQKQDDLADQERLENDWNQDHLPKSKEEEVKSVTSVIKPKDTDKGKDAEAGQTSDSKEETGTDNEIGKQAADTENDKNNENAADTNENQMNRSNEAEDGNTAGDAVQQEGNTDQSEQQLSESKQQEETAAQAKTAETINLHFSPKSDLSWPLQGDVIMNYSMDQTVYFATLEQYKYNPALIIAGKVNEPVNAAATGRITDISTNEETGMTVTMDLGDGYTAVYGQLKEVLYKEDAIVEAGNAIGYIAEPTKYYSVEGSNLYFELQKDNEPVNPMQYIQ